MLAIDSNLVRFVSFDRVVKFEGGFKNPKNIEAALNYVEEAKKMGSTLLRYNTMTKRTDIGYIEVQHRDEIMEAWARHSTTSSTPTAKAAGSQPVGGKDLNGRGGTDSDDEKGQGGNGGKAPKKDKGGKDPKKDKGGKDPMKDKGGKDPKKHTTTKDGQTDKISLQLAIKSKKAYHEATAKATSLLATVKNNPAWKCALQPGRLDDLTGSLANLNQSLSTFAESFMCMDLAMMKNQFSLEEINLGLKRTPGEVDANIAMLNNELAKLNGLHAVELSYKKS